MRITPNDVKNIVSNYKTLKEDVGLGYGVPSQLNVTSIGSQGPKIPRSPIAALKGEVPGGQGEQSNEEFGDMVSGDPEEEMAISNLSSIAAKALELKSKLESGTQIEPWVFSKIILATDYMQTVLDYIEHKKYGGMESERPDFGS